MEYMVRESKRGVLVAVQVVPRAARNEIVGTYGGALRIRLCAPPVGGAANAALIEFLADVLSVPQRQIEIVSGLSSRHKVVAISRLSKDTVEKRLAIVLHSQ